MKRCGGLRKLFDANILRSRQSALTVPGSGDIATSSKGSYIICPEDDAASTQNQAFNAIISKIRAYRSRGVLDCPSGNLIRAEFIFKPSEVPPALRAGSTPELVDEPTAAECSTRQ
jgi:hypothetical protein